MTIRFLPNFPENPSNPARCHVPTGRIEINRSRWDLLTEAERDFVLQHEVGHYACQTFDEKRADDYALRRLAGKKPYSLINFVRAVRSISRNDAERVRHAERRALQVAAEAGSSEARRLLSLPLYAAADGSGCLRFFAPALVALVALILIFLLKN